MSASTVPVAALVPSAPRGPSGLPLVGHLFPFVYDRLGFLQRCAAQYGDVVRLQLGEPTFLLTNPDDIRHVLVVNGENYIKSLRMTSVRGRRLSGSGVLTRTGTAHLRQRRMLKPAFARKTVEGFARTIAEGIRERIAGWTNGAELDIGREMTLVTQRNIVKLALGVDGDRTLSELIAAIAVRRKYMEHVFFSPLPEWLPMPIGAAYRRAMRSMDGAVFDAIRRRRAGDHGDDMLSLLLRAEYEDGTRMTDEQVRDEIVTLFVSGSETNGEALTWTCWLLTQHPAVEARVREEVDRVLGDRPPSERDLPNLTYTNMVLAESMRLYPPTWLFVRMALGSDTLPTGAVIPAGAKVYLSQYVMHRHPRFFRDPDRFDPERFSEDARRSLPQCVYFPFGAGVRLCIGEHLARMESAVTLASIVQQVRLEAMPDQRVTPEPRMTLRPKRPIRLRVVERRFAGNGA
jgi:cytochrome P450